MQRSAAGYSLLELLLVLALVVTCLALAGRWWSEKDVGPALRATEREVYALLTEARVEAIRLGRPTRVLVQLEFTDADPQGVALVAQTPDAGWTPVRANRALRRGAAVVPDSGGPAWPSALCSSFNGEAADGLGGLVGWVGYIQFAAEGTVFGSPQLVVAATRLEPDGVIFVHPSRARLFMIRGSGAIAVRTPLAP